MPAGRPVRIATVPRIAVGEAVAAMEPRKTISLAGPTVIVSAAPGVLVKARVVAVAAQSDAQIIEAPEAAARTARDGQVIVIVELEPRTSEAEEPARVG